MFASFGGGAFAGLSLLWSVAEDCSVVQLRMLATGGTGSVAFACHDGYIPVDTQLGVDSWHPTVGTWASANVAPIYTDRGAFERGDEPVVWAVKAGSFVQRSVCDTHYKVWSATGTCGFFTSRLRNKWTNVAAPIRFGESWGFNITHVTIVSMADAVNEYRVRNNMLPPVFEDTFVVAEGFAQYFGTAIPLFYVMCTLFAVGFLDHVVHVTDARTLETDSEEVDYAGFVFQQVEPISGIEEGTSLWSQADGFWNDPLKTDPKSAVSGVSWPGPRYARVGGDMTEAPVVLNHIR